MTFPEELWEPTAVALEEMAKYVRAGHAFPYELGWDGDHLEVRAMVPRHVARYAKPTLTEFTVRYAP